MDGDITPLDKICDLAEKYNAMVMVDDSHATGYICSSFFIFCCPKGEGKNKGSNFQ